MNENASKNILHILNISIRNKSKFFIGLFLAITSSATTLCIPLIIGNFMEIIMENNRLVQVIDVVTCIALVIGVYIFQGIVSYYLAVIGIDSVKAMYL